MAIDMKNLLITTVGAVGSFIASLFGGWTSSMTTLLIFMCIDYLSGIICAGVFKDSDKSDSGALSSKAGFKGLCKKGMMLLFVLVGARLDIALGATYIRDGVCIAFIVNELLSLIENAGLMGVPIPTFLKNAVELLKTKKTPDLTDTGSDNEKS